MRVKNLMRNSFFGMFGQVVLIGFGFVCQRVLNMKLGEALVGLNSVISNILSILSVTELGIATAVVFNLYRALAAQDEQEIAGLMNLYRKAYYVFAAVITALGLGIMPFLQLFLKENPFTPEYVRLVYFLWLARTVVAYLLSYRRSILIADQQEYVVSIASLLANVLDYSVIILIVNYTGDFVLPLALNIVIDSVCNVWISAYVDRKYPFLRRLRKEPLDKKLRIKVFDNVKNIFASHLADKLLVATDNVIISSFISVAFAGLYNNYCLITNALTNIARALSNAIQPSVGTMFVEDHKQGGQLLRVVTFLFFLFASSTACAVYTVINPFVRDVWLGDSYLMELSVVALYVINYFLLILSLPVAMVMGVTGLFDRERNIALISAACNMLLSIGLVRVCGIYGVLLGTLVAYVMQVSYRVHVFHHIYLGVSMRVYVMDLLQYLALGFGESVLVSRLAEQIYQPGSIVRFLMVAVLAAGLPLALNLVLYAKSWRMRSIFSLFRHKN